MVCRCHCCYRLFARLPRFTARQTLLVTTVLTAAFALSQMVAASLSHSLSLLGDSGDMAIDTLTYALAYIVEVRRARHGHLSKRAKLLENVVIASSGLTLVVGSALLIYDAVKRLRHLGDGSQEDVNVDYILAFASANLLIDIVQVALFLGRFAGRQNKAREDVNLVADSILDTPTGHSNAMLDDSLSSAQDPGNLNVFSAFVHVGADTLRTVSELASAFIVKILRADPTEVDAKTSLLINATIFASGVFILRSLLMQCKQPPEAGSGSDDEVVAENEVELRRTQLQGEVQGTAEPCSATFDQE